MVAIYRLLSCGLRQLYRPHSHHHHHRHHRHSPAPHDSDAVHTHTDCNEPHWIPAAAGSVAGLTLLLLDRGASERRTTFALYAMTRAVSYLVRDAVASGRLPHIPYASVWLFQICCFEIMYEWFYSPENLPKSYVKWISKLACMNPHLLLTLRTYATSKREVVMTHFNRYLHSAMEGTRHAGIPFPYTPGLVDPYNRLIDCCVVHPNSIGGFGSCGAGTPNGTAGNWAWRWCMHNSWMRFVTAFRIACTQVYGPVHFIPVLLFKIRSLIGSLLFGPRDPSTPPPSKSNVARALLSQLLLRPLANTIRSSAFIAAFVGSIWWCICATRNLVSDDLRIGPALGSAVCGLSLFIEHPSRRDELALYCVPRALQGIWSRLQLPTTAIGGQTALLPLFAASLGIICYYAHHQQMLSNPTPTQPHVPVLLPVVAPVIKSSHLQLIQFFFGRPPPARLPSTIVVTNTNGVTTPIPYKI